MVYHAKFQPRMVEKPPFSIEVPGYDPIDGEGVPRRHPLAKDGLLQQPLDAPEVRTVFDLVERAAAKFADRPALGSRRLVRTVKEKKRVPKVVEGGKTIEVEKEWTYLELSGYEYQTFSQYRAMTHQLGAGLKSKLGMQRGDKLHIFASTSARWIAMSHAASAQSLTIVTAYDTLGESGVEHTLVQSKASTIFVDPHLLKTIQGPLKRGSAGSLKNVIYNDASLQPVPESEIERFKTEHPELTVISFEDLRASGEGEGSAVAAVEPDPPKPEDTYCIMYTSGSTGTPKGVPVTHAGFIAAVGGVHAPIRGCVSPDDCVLAYLPLAHIFELVVENLVLLVGATLGYGSPRTLSDGASVRNCKGDMREFRPTIMVGVPQIWETVRKGVQAKVDSSGTLTKTVFNFAVSAKDFLVRNNLPGQSIFDSLVFGAVRDVAGGKLRFALNGATGISKGTADFLSLVLAPLISGYGLTETCGNGAIGSPLQWNTDAIGAPPPSVEVKLVSIPDLGYFADGGARREDEEVKGKTAPPPQGEILIRGAPVIREYYENPEETSKVITADGWFRTGDIGEWDANGQLRIIDRLKNLVKLQGGEYIALEKLEAIYRGSHAVHTLMVYGDSENPRPIAIVQPNEKVLADMAARAGVEAKTKTAKELHHDETVKAVVLKDLVSVAREANLTGLEIVCGVVLVDEEWTPANGLVTATQKVNRKAVKEKYRKEIDVCFGSQ